ncbi:MAG: MarR family transcriptional regulator [Candidatus Omnitrophota bacterium]|jgi:DNA-binding MarR family transcriptional regulator
MTKVTDLDRLNNTGVRRLINVSEAIIKTADRFFAKFGVTTAQYDILAILKYSERKLTQSDLGINRVVSRSNITGILDRLERIGMAKREGSADDRRVKYISITKKGLDLIEKVESKYFDNVKKLVWFLDEKDKKELVGILDRLERGLKRSENDL